MDVYFFMFLAGALFMWIIWELWRSPKGYENEHGFHFSETENAGKIKMSHASISEVKEIQHAVEETSV